MSSKDIDNFFKKEEKPYLLPLILALAGVVFLITYFIVPISAHSMVFLFGPAMALAFLALVVVLVVYFKERKSDLEVNN
ncbi:hypothetical protein [Methanonatronarchaeum thermophilum]|uniref:hypothetical protein n=1 Tax=Methanonatronarchaeum thermophilum TaxID=1927129 RepID=UPI000A3D040E|nr:hypothetical protein [Methanonatronarchaeum thermophilum]